MTHTILYHTHTHMHTRTCTHTYTPHMYTSHHTVPHLIFARYRRIKTVSLTSFLLVLAVSKGVFQTSKGKPDQSTLWSMNLESDSLIKFSGHNADRSGLPLLVQKRLKVPSYMYLLGDYTSPAHVSSGTHIVMQPL